MRICRGAGGLYAGTGESVDLIEAGTWMQSKSSEWRLKAQAQRLITRLPSEVIFTEVPEPEKIPDGRGP